MITCINCNNKPAVPEYGSLCEDCFKGKYGTSGDLAMNWRHNDSQGRRRDKKYDTKNNVKLKPLPSTLFCPKCKSMLKPTYDSKMECTKCRHIIFNSNNK